MRSLYVGIGLGDCCGSYFFFICKKVPVLADPHEGDVLEGGIPNKPLFGHRHFIWAVVAQFFNVAAQGGTWAFFINYGHEMMGFSDEKAGNLIALFSGH